MEATQIQDWRTLLMEKERGLQFRFIGRELDMKGFLHARSTITRTLAVLTTPSERKKWDIRMQEMIQIPQHGGIVFIYAAERKLYEFHSEAQVERKENKACVSFMTRCYEVKRPNTILADMNSKWECEELEDEPVVPYREDEEGNPIKKLRLEWTAHFCENAFETVRGDVFQEANTLQKSFERLTRLLENVGEDWQDMKSLNPLIDAPERKKLTKTFSMGNFEYFK
jgi:hypothetical protein